MNVAMKPDSVNHNAREVTFGMSFGVKYCGETTEMSAGKPQVFRGRPTCQSCDAKIDDIFHPLCANKSTIPEGDESENVPGYDADARTRCYPIGDNVEPSHHERCKVPVLCRS